MPKKKKKELNWGIKDKVGRRNMILMSFTIFFRRPFYILSCLLLRTHFYGQLKLWNQQMGSLGIVFGPHRRIKVSKNQFNKILICFSAHMVHSIILCTDGGFTKPLQIRHKKGVDFFHFFPPFFALFYSYEVHLRVKFLYCFDEKCISLSFFFIYIFMIK